MKAGHDTTTARTSSVSSQLMELSPLMIRILRAQLQKAAIGVLTHPQYRILANLFRGLNTVTQIALNHGVSQPTMTKTVNLMVAKKWIEKKSSPADARHTHLKMTDLGLKVFLRVKKQTESNISQQLENLSSDEIRVLNRCLSELSPVIQKLTGPKEKSK